MPLPSCSCRPCTCGNTKAIASTFFSHQLMQFLMGLNESFDSVRSQILLLDSIPSVNKVYSMVLIIEKQQEVTDIFTETVENTALCTRSSSTKSAGRYQSRTDLIHVGFWAPFLCGVKAQIVRAYLSHLFKWRGVRLGQKRVCSFCEKYCSQRERQEEKKSLCDFRTSTRDRFSNYNCRFVHRWIGLIFG